MIHRRISSALSMSPFEVSVCAAALPASATPKIASRVEAYLPRVDANVASVSSHDFAPTSHGSETILLVEDDDHLRMVSADILRRHGYRVLEACHAAEALRICDKHTEPIHLLLTDVVMPNMSGLELAKRLAVARPEMTLLCMSGHADDSVLQHGVLGTEIAYVQKPITPQTLTKRVREVLDAPTSRVPVFSEISGSPLET